MATILRPQKQQDGLSKLANVVQIGAGIASLGTPAAPQGAMSALQGAKGITGQNASPDLAVPMAQSESAASRRLSTLSQDTDKILQTLREGEEALNELPQEARKTFAQPLFETMIQTKRKMREGGIL